MRTSHPFRMWDAIMETPKAVRRCLTPEVVGQAHAAGKSLVERGIRRIFLIGCGSSNYAAMATAYALRDLAGVDADAYDAFEFANYYVGRMHNLGSSPISDRIGVIAFSHSGSTRAVVDAARLARERGALTICLTDMPDSLLASHSDIVVPVGGGLEPVEPKTRSYVSTLVMGYQLAAAVGGAIGSGEPTEPIEPAEPTEPVKPVKPIGSTEIVTEQISRLPRLLEDCRALQGQVKELASKYRRVKRVFAVGGGPNYATALEIALKFKEAVLLAGEGMEVEEAFHGSIASLDRDTLVIAISAPGPSYQRVGDFARAASLMGCPVVSVAHNLDGVDTVRVPLTGLSETFTNSVLVYPLYMLAYYSALARGNNPDVFRVGDLAFHAALSAVPPLSYRE